MLLIFNQIDNSIFKSNEVILIIDKTKIYCKIKER